MNIFHEFTLWMWLCIQISRILVSQLSLRCWKTMKWKSGSWAFICCLNYVCIPSRRAKMSHFKCHPKLCTYCVTVALMIQCHIIHILFHYSCMWYCGTSAKQLIYPCIHPLAVLLTGYRSPGAIPADFLFLK